MRPEDIDGLTVGGLLDLVAERRPEDEALVYADRDLRYTYTEFKEVVEKCARALMALGIEKGDHVAVWGQNVPEWVTLQFATGKVGAVLVTINPAYKVARAEVRARPIRRRGPVPDRGVKDADFLQILQGAVPELAEARDGELSIEELPFLKHVVLMGGDPPEGLPAHEASRSFWRGERKSLTKELRERQESLDAEEVINMQYTSGTTGFPKGVQLTHTNIVKNAFYIGECMKLGPEDRVCIPVPFFHCFGCVLGTLNTVTHEGTMVPVESFDAEKVLAGRGRGTVHGAPRGADDVHCGAGAPGLRAIRHQFFAHRHHGRLPLPDGGHEEGRRRDGRLGDHHRLRPDRVEPRHHPDPHRRPAGAASIQRRTQAPRRRGPHRQRRDGRGLRGRKSRASCWTRGYHVMRGYYKMEEKTSEVIDDEGWLHTGDLAVMDEDGYVRITGRAKDMIIRGGENVYPREIEEFLYTHPEVSDVQVYGVPDEKYGEKVAAAVKLREDSELTAEDVKRLLPREHRLLQSPRVRRLRR